MNKKLSKIRMLNNREINDVAKIHYKLMEGTFSKLGIEFIKKFYHSVNIVGKFYVKKKNNKIIAYGCWTINTSRLNFFFLKNNFWFLILFIIKNFFTKKFIVVIKFFFFLILKHDSRLPNAELIAVAKLKIYNKPFFTEFIKILEKDLKSNNIKEYYVYVSSRLMNVTKMYLKNNYRIIKKINLIYPCLFLIKKI